MKKNIIYLLSSLLFLPTLMACSDFLDQDPDMRTKIDTEEKVSKLLVTAYIYQAGSYIITAELSSDNVCDNGSTSNYDTLPKDMYEWNDDATTGNDSPYRVWGASFEAISTANEALVSIDEIGGTDTDKLSTLLKACKGEALLCRAYHYFILANMFCMPYYGDGSEEEYLGLPYLTEPEGDLYPHYERGTLKNVYDHIQADIEEGLPLIDDTQYSVPKYHFNEKAAYTFASRFYVFTKQWDKAIEAATHALGSDPSTFARDYSSLSDFSGNSAAQLWVDTDIKANFLMQAAISSGALWTNNWSSMNRYTHYLLVGKNETCDMATPFEGGAKVDGSSDKWKRRSSYSSSQKYVLYQTYREFQYTDIVAATGYNRSITPILTAEEAMLNRAEAYIMKQDYNSALEDLNCFARPFYKDGYFVDMTLAIAKQWASSTFEEYSEPYIGKGSTTTAQTLNPRKHLLAYPYNELVGGEGGDQECMMQVLIYCRRYHFLHVGMRWFDTRRFGITVYRFLLDEDLETILQATDAIADEGETNENATRYSSGHIDSYGHNLRRALQIPQDIRTAGLEANPR